MLAELRPEEQPLAVGKECSFVERDLSESLPAASSSTMVFRQALTEVMELARARLPFLL